MPSRGASRSCPRAGAIRVSASTSASAQHQPADLRPPDASASIINPTPRRAAADRQINDLQIKTASRDARASSLSGGNQQKIVIGKWLNHGAELFIFDEPTVGVDVGTKAEIYRLFADAAAGRAPGSS